MLEQLKAKSAQTAALAKETAGKAAAAISVPASLKEVTEKGSQALQSGSQALQSHAKLAAQTLHIKVPTVIAGSKTKNAETESETDLESNSSEATGAKNEEQEGLLDDFAEQCHLSKRQRLMGAIGCYAFGALCGFMSTLMLWGGPKHVKQFAFFYTVGNISSIGSSLFLVGPKRQFKVMCMPVRRVACCVWFSAMIATLIVSFGFPKAAPISMMLVIIQYGAMLWYGASYIPYGRTILKKLATKLTSTVMS